MKHKKIKQKILFPSFLIQKIRNTRRNKVENSKKTRYFLMRGEFGRNENFVMRKFFREIVFQGSFELVLMTRIVIDWIDVHELVGKCCRHQEFPQILKIAPRNSLWVFEWHKTLNYLKKLSFYNFLWVKSFPQNIMTEKIDESSTKPQKSNQF